MTKKVLCLALFCFLLNSCSEDIFTDDFTVQDHQFDDLTIQDHKPEVVKFHGSEIGMMENGKLVFNKSKKSILKSFQNLPGIAELKLTPERLEVVEIDGKSYLRIYSNNNYVSTTEIIMGDPNSKFHPIAEIGGTTCTSTDCASGGGCIPEGDYCTKCTTYNFMGVPSTGDCTRSTSN